MLGEHEATSSRQLARRARSSGWGGASASVERTAWPRRRSRGASSPSLMTPGRWISGHAGRPVRPDVQNGTRDARIDARSFSVERGRVKGSDERNQSVERLLRQSLSTPPRHATDACLDAETIAAWLDGGLSGPALEVAESHVADCARCQLIAGSVIRVVDSGANVPAPVRRWWPAWLVPLGAATAAAAAVVLWVVVPRAPSISSSPETPAAAPAASGQTVQTKTDAPASLINRLEVPAAPKQEQQAAKDAPGAPAAGPESRRDAGKLEADKIAPAQATPAQAPATDAFAAREGAGARSGNAAALAAPVNIEIVSPDPAIRWRTVGLALEHSTNGGTTWAAAATDTSQWLAGAAPATTVCWVVGRGGVVLLSTDGRSFSRVPFPEMTDLSAVQAADGRSASVTTADGRRFTTTDAGATWR